jgi:phytanoyl-CoA hydroxylase
MTTASAPSAPATPVSTVPLSPEDLTAFAEQGFLIARGLLRAEDLEPVRQELSAAIDRKAHALLADGVLSDLHEDLPFGKRFGYLMAQSPRIQEGFDVNQLRGQAMFGFLHHQRLLDAMEQLLGTEVSCNPIQHVRAKPPQQQTADANKGYFSVPWHQDSGVNVVEADASNIITTWIPLVDVDESMGCLQVMPQAHRHGHLPHDASGGYGTAIKAANMPKLAPLKCPVRAGDVIIMHRHCPHHSTPNRSDRCRWSLDLRWHTTGHNSGRPWQPEFVVRSQRDPASVMNDHDTWDRLWRECLASPGGGRVVHRVE